MKFLFSFSCKDPKNVKNCGESDINIMREDLNLNQYRNYAFPVWAVYLVSIYE